VIWILGFVSKKYTYLWILLAVSRRVAGFQWKLKKVDDTTTYREEHYVTR